MSLLAIGTGPVLYGFDCLQFTEVQSVMRKLMFGAKSLNPIIFLLPFQTGFN